jgi:putative endonuclease
MLEQRCVKHVYILRSLTRPGQRYVGVTGDLDQRLEYHNTGRCPHTSKFVPWEIMHTEVFDDDTTAFRRERQIKGWSRAKKEALIGGDKQRLKDLSRCRNR